MGELEARIEDLSTRLAAKRKERDNYIRLCARGSISENELDSYLAGLGIEAETTQLLLDDARSELAAKEHDRLAAKDAQDWLLAPRDRIEEVEGAPPRLIRNAVSLYGSLYPVSRLDGTPIVE